MQFAYFHWLWIGVLSCLALSGLLVWFERRRQTLLQQFAHVSLLSALTSRVSHRWRGFKRVLLILGLGLLFLTLARPQWGFEWREIHTQGVDVLIAVDVSRSMLAQDIKPNRLERVKLGLTDFVQRMQGNRIGLLPFSGAAFLLCPLTLDYDAFLQAVQELDIHVVRAPGTNIEAALMEAQQAFAHAPEQQKTLILISDGEALSGDVVAAARQAALQGIKIYTVGVGTAAGELIPLEDSTGQTGGFVKNRSGNFVKSKLDEATLRQIAQVTGGAYYFLGKQSEGLDSIYQRHLSWLSGAEAKQEAKKQKIPLERFQFPLAGSLFLFFLEFWISDSKKKSKSLSANSSSPLLQRVSAMLVCALLVFFTCLLAAQAHAQEHDPRLSYNAGTSLYRQNNFSQAEQSFRSALEAQNLSLQQDSYYNLGNTLYREGEQAASAPQRLRLWEQALQAYQGALELNKKDPDARFNHELVRRKIDELKKEQEREQQKKQNQNQKKSQNPQQNSPSGQQDNQEQNQQQGQQQENTENNQPPNNQNNQQNSSPQGSQGQHSSTQNSQEGGGQNQASPSQSQGSQASPQENGQQAQQNPQTAKSDLKGSQGAGSPNPSNASSGMNIQNKKETPSTRESNAAAKTQTGNGNTSAQQVTRQAEGSGHRPGEMSAQQATALLDALKEDEQRMLFVPAPGSQALDSPQEDW